MRHNSVTSNIVGGTTKLETKTELNNLNESKNNFIQMNPTTITKDRKVNDQVSVKSVNIEMLTLNYEELELNSGEICKLEVTIDSDNVAYDQVLFMSTSEDILEVDKNGIVTAVNQGVAVVLVTVGEKTVACYVVVN
ncbi:Ig-like domain-containing protein [Turicibacter bilis]|uniref:Ig-like domain-containing protein n=1 Tax=Turicibacter bilis TaxID=2735723 RepID=A0A9Q9CN54_9FIRM|nr:Ig-like domain-containing protein [Turicibacter bilis]MBS3196886.1 Ig-like domain-containing protein [Turicibacter bilis]MBS3201633.1 Ig-like domain-containing protein [Turicibacter bilis]UUF07184.1 Ig-like domain-containing protein [Turicibacter bilis]UUF08406.1 Ig-like domain-containing protein [Turicibacter bilis]